jgi:hypothetical protein
MLGAVRSVVHDDVDPAEAYEAFREASQGGGAA